MPGVEKLTVEMGQLGPDEYPPLQFGDGLASSLGYIKGWARSVCLLFVLDSIVLLNLLDQAQARPHFFRTLCVAHGIFTAYQTVADRVAASRELTLSSVSTRKRPNAFTWLFQIQKVISSGGAEDGPAAVMSWSRSSAVASVLSISTEEAKTALNLLSGTTPEFRDQLKALAEEFGMGRGSPLSHQALSSYLVVLSRGPPHPTVAWDAGLKNTAHSLKLMGHRFRRDWETTPKSVRKTVGLPEMGALQQRCAAFSFYCRLLEAEVPKEYYDEKLPHLEVRCVGFEELESVMCNSCWDLYANYFYAFCFRQLKSTDETCISSKLAFQFSCSSPFQFCFE